MRSRGAASSWPKASAAATTRRARTCSASKRCKAYSAIWMTLRRTEAMRQRIIERQSLNGSGVIIGEPYASMSNVQGIAARARPLTLQTVLSRIDEREWHLRHAGPYLAVAKGDVAAVPRRSERDGAGATAE